MGKAEEEEMSEIIGGSLCIFFGLFFAMGFGIETGKETGLIWPFIVSLFFTGLGIAILTFRERK